MPKPRAMPSPIWSNLRACVLAKQYPGLSKHGSHISPSTRKTQGVVSNQIQRQLANDFQSIKTIFLKYGPCKENLK